MPLFRKASTGTADISNLVVKETGKSLVSDTEIAKIHSSGSDNQSLSGLEPANINIQAHVTSAHAPSTAQKNSDITKIEIEAKLIGELSSHTHASSGGGLTHAQTLKRTL
jgi:hypothetical protein